MSHKDHRDPAQDSSKDQVEARLGMPQLQRWPRAVVQGPHAGTSCPPHVPPGPRALQSSCKPGHQHGLCFPKLTAPSYLAGQVGALCIRDCTVGGRIRMAIGTKGSRVPSPPSTALSSPPRFQQDAQVKAENRDKVLSARLGWAQTHGEGLQGAPWYWESQREAKHQCTCE